MKLETYKLDHTHSISMQCVTFDAVANSSNGHFFRVHIAKSVGKPAEDTTDYDVCNATASLI